LKEEVKIDMDGFK